MHTNLNVILCRHIRKQADILEGTGNTHPVDLSCVHALGINTLQQNGAAGGLIHAGQQIEDSCFTGAVGADQTGDLGRANGDIKAVNSSQAAKIDAKIPHIQHRELVSILFTKEAIGGNLNHFLGILTHQIPPPSSW